MIYYSKIILIILFLVDLNNVYSQDIYNPVKTTIVAKDSGFILVRAGKPYFIKGAGGYQLYRPIGKIWWKLNSHMG